MLIAIQSSSMSFMVTYELLLHRLDRQEIWWLWLERGLSLLPSPLARESNQLHSYYSNTRNGLENVHLILKSQLSSFSSQFHTPPIMLTLQKTCAPLTNQRQTQRPHNSPFARPGPCPRTAPAQMTASPEAAVVTRSKLLAPLHSA